MKITNKIISVIITVMIIVSSFPMTAFANQNVDASGTNQYCTWSYDAETETVYIDAVDLTNDKEDDRLPLFTESEINDEEGNVTSVKEYFDGTFKKLVFGESISSISNIKISSKNYSPLRTVTFDENAPITVLPDELFKDSNITKITLPAELEEIGKSCIECTNIISITIPGTVTKIGEKALYSNELLKTVTFESGEEDRILKLSNYTFSGNWKMAYPDFSGINILNGEIPEHCFEGCTNLGDVVIPDGITSIGDYAFKDTVLSSLVFEGEAEKSIGAYAFYNAKISADLTIPECVTSIGSFAFGEMSCEELYVNPGTSTIPSGCFCDTLFSSLEFGEHVRTLGDNSFNAARTRNLTGTLKWNIDFSETNITRIKKSAFYESKITGVSFENSQITEIGEKAFSKCIYLKSVNLNGSIDTIGSNAFSNCTKLTSLTANDIYGIDDYAFSGCYNISSINLNNVEYLGDYVFQNCKALTTVSFDNVLEIGAYTFSNCSSLEEIDLGNIELIGRYAFKECTALTHIELPESITAFYDSGTFANCSNLQTVSLSDNTTRLAASMFENCASLKEINIPSNLKAIGPKAFMNCYELEEFDFTQCPDLESIGYRAFMNCSSLARADFENSKITSIAEELFSGCTSLEPTFVIGSNVSKIYSGALENTSVTDLIVYSLNVQFSSDCVDNENINSISAYSNTTAETFARKNNFKFYSLGLPPGNDLMSTYDARGTCGSCTFYFSNSSKTLTICGSGAFDEADMDCIGYTAVKNASTGATDYVLSSFSMPFANFLLKYNPTTINFCEGITEINQTLQNYTTSYNLYLPGTLEYIAPSAFKYSSLISVDFGDATNFEIGEYAFFQTSLTEVTIPNGVTKIGDYAFCKCPKLSKVTIEGNFEWGTNVFSNCTNLATIDFGRNVTAIGDYAFAANQKITEITLPERIERIGKFAFSGCRISRITLPESTKFIGKGAFANCNNLIHVDAHCVDVEIHSESEKKDNPFGYNSTGYKLRDFM